MNNLLSQISAELEHFDAGEVLLFRLFYHIRDGGLTLTGPDGKEWSWAEDFKAKLKAYTEFRKISDGEARHETPAPATPLEPELDKTYAAFIEGGSASTAAAWLRKRLDVNNFDGLARKRSFTAYPDLMEVQALIHTGWITRGEPTNEDIRYPHQYWPTPAGLAAASITMIQP
jgi:hypothetical protein